MNILTSAEESSDASEWNYLPAAFVKIVDGNLCEEFDAREVKKVRRIVTVVHDVVCVMTRVDGSADFSG